MFQKVTRITVKKDPVSITTIEEYYAVSASGSEAPTTGWTLAVPELTSTLKYLWNYSKIIFSDGNHQDSTPSVIGVYGKGIQTVVDYYLATSASSGVTTSTQGWTTAVQAPSDAKRYLWNYEVVTYTDGTTSSTAPHIIGVYGQKGDPGVSITNVTEYYKVSTANTGVSNTDNGWSTNIPTLTATNKYLWNFELITYSDGDTAMTPAVVIGVYGDQGNQGGTGNGISSITNYYLATTASSGVTTSTSGWTTSVQAPTESKRYLWNYEVVTYTNGQSTVTTPHIIGVYGQKGEDGQDGKDGKDGKDGTGIANVTEYYKVSSSSSGVRNTDSGWSTTIPTLTATNKYLWNFELITYDDGDTLMTPAVIIGVYGDQGPTGNGISSITNYYLASASGSGVTTSTYGWTAAVQAPTEAKKYLWNYEAVTYTNGNTELTTPHIIGVYGEKGNKGDKGDQGDAGPVAPFMGDYDSSQMYYGNAYRTDIVRYSNIYYVARSDAPSSSFSGKTPTNTSYWRQFGQWFKSVATDILFTNIATIENAIIRMLQTADSGKRIVIRNNTMTMYDANGAMKMLISGDTLSDAPSSTSTTLSEQTQLNKTISFPSVRDGWSVTGSGGVTISVTNAANTVRLPSLSCSYTVNPEFTSGELEGLVEFYYLIDGVAYTPVRKELYWSYGSSKSGTLTLPAQSVTLSTGSHTVKVACKITLTGSAADTGTLDYNATSNSGTIYIDYAVQKFELGENGWRVMFASNYLAEFKKVGSALSGVAFLLRTGNYGLQITPSGIKKMTDGTNWVSL